MAEEEYKRDDELRAVLGEIAENPERADLALEYLSSARLTLDMTAWEFMKCALQCGGKPGVEFAIRMVDCLSDPWAVAELDTVVGQHQGAEVLE